MGRLALRHRLDRRRSWRRPTRDEGAAVAEFVLVVSLLLLVALGVIQVGVLLHVRNVLVADAAEGARHAASLGMAAESGGGYAERLVAETLPSAARDVHCAGSATAVQGAPVTQVRCTGHIRLGIVPLGVVTVHAAGHAMKEMDR